MRTGLIVAALFSISATAACSSLPAARSTSEATDEVARALDDLSRSSAEPARYLSHFTPDARIVEADTGTIVRPSELAALARATLVHVDDRSRPLPKHHITMTSSGRVAWFDQIDANNANNGGDQPGPQCRMGLIVRDPVAGWRVARCELSVGGGSAPTTPTASTTQSAERTEQRGQPSSEHPARPHEAPLFATPRESDE